MKFTKELKFQTIVLLAKRPAEFQPNVFNQFWLHSKNIIDGNNIDMSASYFAPEAANIVTPNLTIAVMADQLQIASKSLDFNLEMSKTIKPLIHEMPEIELQALGMNFNWFMLNSDISYNELSKTLFNNTKEKASSYFEDPTSKYGVYYSKQINDHIRLKLDIKPAKLFDATDKTHRDSIHFAFNFHSDLLASKQKDQVEEIIDKYEELHGITKTIMDLY